MSVAKTIAQQVLTYSPEMAERQHPILELRCLAVIAIELSDIASALSQLVAAVEALEQTWPGSPTTE